MSHFGFPTPLSILFYSVLEDRYLKDIQQQQQLVSRITVRNKFGGKSNCFEREQKKQSLSLQLACINRFIQAGGSSKGFTDLSLIVTLFSIHLLIHLLILILFCYFSQYLLSFIHSRFTNESLTRILIGKGLKFHKNQTLSLIIW